MKLEVTKYYQENESIFVDDGCLKGEQQKRDGCRSKTCCGKTKGGRPPAVKKLEPPLIPFPAIALTTSTTAATKRKNYDHGSPKAKMEYALKLVLKSKGKHMQRTAKSYNIDVKALVKRYNAANKDEADRKDFVNCNRLNR